MLAGDRISLRSRQINSIFDSTLHGIISLLILIPLCQKPYDYLIAFLAASLFDIDHFVSARSLKIKDAVSLSRRPKTHSVTFALLISTALWFLLPLPFRNYMPIMIFISLTSHVIRDSADGKTLIFWPFRINKVPYPLYITLEIMLLFIVTLISPLRTLNLK